VGFEVLNLPVSFGDETIISDIAYGAESEQKLDIYLPNDAGPTQHDVVVFFYGGRWTNGAKEDYRFVGMALAEQGFVVVIPNYRKYPQVHFPVFVQDGAKALAWVYDNINDYHGAQGRINVAGHSAGALIGALLAADERYLSGEHKNRTDIIHSFVGLAGPYDFTPDEPDLKDMFGPPENYPQMQATTFIDGKQPPMLLLYGAKDTTVKPYNLENLLQRIKDKGGYVRSIIYPDIDHIDIIVALSWLGSSHAPVIEDMVEFFNSTK
jgi:acetyl esterase/lipase